MTDSSDASWLSTSSWITATMASAFARLRSTSSSTTSPAFFRFTAPALTSFFTIFSARSRVSSVNWALLSM